MRKLPAGIATMFFKASACTLGRLSALPRRRSSPQVDESPPAGPFLGVREDDHEDRRYAENEPGAGGCQRDGCRKWSPLPARERFLHLLPAKVPVEDQRASENRIPGADDLVRPGGAARELRNDASGGEPDRERSKAGAPPGEMRPLVREVRPSRRVLDLHRRRM